MNVIRHREFGTMSEAKANEAAKYLNVINGCERYEAKHRFAKRWIVIEKFDVCDIRCADAQGDECTCKCGGVNHGKAVA